MENKQDFFITKGVLDTYIGPGGDVASRQSGTVPSRTARA